MKQTSFRGVVFTHADVLRAMELFDLHLRSSFRRKRWSVTYAIEHYGKLYPPTQIMRLTTKLTSVGGSIRSLNSLFEDLGFTIVTLDENEQFVTPHRLNSKDVVTEDELRTLLAQLGLQAAPNNSLPIPIDSQTPIDEQTPVCCLYSDANKQLVDPVAVSATQ